MSNIIDDTSANKYFGTADWDSTIKAKWLREYTYTSTNENAKVVAYLLDKTQWSGFANSSYAEYAIGGPTLELFRDSYNAIHSVKTIETQTTERGYQLRWSGVGSYDYKMSGLSTSESLYVINNNANAIGMWMASPSDNSYSHVMYVYYSGDVFGYYYYFRDRNIGARPIISLKSNIKIEKQENGTYNIVE